jgi:hypothetical protein
MTMPGHQDIATAAEPGTLPTERQPRMSRRSALRTAATTGVAVTALAATSGPALAAARPARAERDDTGRDAADRNATVPDATVPDVTGRAEADPGEPIVAHLRDTRTGEIDMFRGTSRVRLRDPALAALLVRASS